MAGLTKQEISDLASLEAQEREWNVERANLSERIDSANVTLTDLRCQYNDGCRKVALGEKVDLSGINNELKMLRNS